MSFSHWYNKSTFSGSTARGCKRSLRNKSLKLQLLLYVFLSQGLQKNTFQKMGASTGAENIPNLHPEILAMGFKTLCLHFQAIILTGRQDRKSTRLNSSHVRISYAVFCLKKK